MRLHAFFENVYEKWFKIKKRINVPFLLELFSKIKYSYDIKRERTF